MKNKEARSIMNLRPESCMKIDEKLFYCRIPKTSGKILYDRHNTQTVIKDKDLFSHQFSPCGRAGGAHLLRYSGIKPGALHPVASSAKSTGMLLSFRPLAEISSHPFYGW